MLALGFLQQTEGRIELLSRAYILQICEKKTLFLIIGHQLLHRKQHIIIIINIFI